MSKLRTVAPKKTDIASELKSENGKKAIEDAAYCILGFVLSSCYVLRIASPFSISLISVSKKHNFLFAALGSAFGYLVFCPDSFARYIVAVLITALGTLALSLSQIKRQVAYSMLLSFTALAATGVVANVRAGEPLSAYVQVFAESMLGLGGAFFFFRALGCNFRRFRLKALSVSDLTCLVVSASIVLMGLARFTVAGFSPARMLAVLAILMTAHYGADRFGFILSLVLGFALGIEQSATVFLAGAYGFSTLLATLFCSVSAWGAAVSFSLSVALFCASAGSPAGLFITVESVAAGFLFAVMPPFITKKTQEFFHDGADIAPDGSLRQSLVVKLRFASSAMNHISESVNEVREKINEVNAKNAEKMKSTLTEQEYISREIINEKTNEIRMLASDQFFSIADMLSDLAREFDEAEYFDNIAAGRIRRFLGEYEIYPQNISVIEDKFGRTRVEIMTYGRDDTISRAEIQKQISKICGRYFEKCRVTHFRDDSMISFSERPNYSFEIGFAQHSAEGRLCGDTVKIVNDGRGHSILIISDGMGRGGRAALDGAMGAGLLSKLLCAGFGFDSALKVVNSALLVKSNEESLATIDCACVDLFTGRVELYKAGAPATFIVKNGRVNKCELSSMPAGILRGIEFAKRTAVLGNGSLIVMVSDGITEAGGDWLPAMLRCFEGRSAQEIADSVLKEALKMSDGKKEDDMSIIAARLKAL